MSFRCEVITRRGWSGVAAAALILVVSLGACTEAKPASYPMRAMLPFGTVQMSVQNTEASSDLNHKTILVHVRMERLEGQEQARVASQSWDQFFMLADRNGKKYKCHRFLPTDYYYQNYANMGGRGADDTLSTVPTQWVAHFDVPLDAEGFTLLINNMTFHAGSQPTSIAVPLDR